MYIKKYKNFLPADYIEKFNIKKSKKNFQLFLLLSILNLIILSINLNLEGKKFNNVNNEKYINNENLNYNRKDKKNTILKLESVLKNNSLNNLLIKDNKFIFKIKEEELSVVINIINKIGEIDELIYLNEENLIQGEGRIK